MSRKMIATTAAPAAIGSYAQGIVAQGWVYVSGQLPLDPATGEMVAGDAAAQTQRVLQNLQAILAAAGAALTDVVKDLTDMQDFGIVNGVYATYFAADPPARTCLGVAALPRGAKVAMDVVAVLP